MSQAPPTVFVSHATEDKQRFVLGFAERLRANGVDAWLDQWEMSPGDSLVAKIFEEGIGRADIFLIVLSHNSIAKPWVREELDAGLVMRIEGQCRVIPVLIDDVEVPVALRATVWQRVADADSYDDEFQALSSMLTTARARAPASGCSPGCVPSAPTSGVVSPRATPAWRPTARPPSS